MAGPTIRATGDVPIVEPLSFKALGLVPFQINPHFLDAEPGSTDMGETREQQIEEIPGESDRIVVGRPARGRQDPRGGRARQARWLAPKEHA